MSNTGGGGAAFERRRSRRRPVLNSFSLFVVVPDKGVHRLQIHDLSEMGVGFDIDTEGETPEAFPVKQGQQLELKFYLNQSLYLPLKVQVARIENRDAIRRVGAEFVDQKSKNHDAFLSFMEMLDSIIDVVRLDSEPQKSS